MSKEEQIGKLYIQYHAKRKLIAELKYTRTVEFGECENDNYKTADIFDDTDNCYWQLKNGFLPKSICKTCQLAWDRHLEISILGKQAGGLKNSLNKIISEL